jgi:TonB family protein
MISLALLASGANSGIILAVFHDISLRGANRQEERMKSFASFASCILALTISIAQAQTPQKSKPRRAEAPGGVLQGLAIKQVTPSYPPIARAARAAGKVEVQITISEKGKVIEAIVISGHPLLRDASVNAAKQWVFQPTELSGVPVKVQGILTFNFTLDEDDSKEPDVVPSEAQGYLARGKARLAKDDAEGAIADFTKAIELDSKSALFYLNRGMALFLKEKEAEAQRDFDRCLELDQGFKPGLERQIKAIKERRAKPNR